MERSDRQGVAHKPCLHDTLLIPCERNPVGMGARRVERIDIRHEARNTTIGLVAFVDVRIEVVLEHILADEPALSLIHI